MKPVAVIDGATLSSLVKSTDVAFNTVFYNYTINIYIKNLVYQKKLYHLTDNEGTV